MNKDKFESSHCEPLQGTIFPTNRPIRLVVVDDCASDIELLRSVLESMSRIEIIALRSGSDAMEWLANPDWSACDLVLIDWRLPGVSGREVARAFLDKMPETRFPVAVLSSSLPPHVSAELHKWGAAVFGKPSDLDGYQSLAQSLVELARGPVTKVPT